MSISVRYIVAAACCVAVLFAASLFLGSVPIPLRAVLGILTGGEAGQASWSFIVLESRLPQAVTALLAGAALATSGLMLQTVSTIRWPARRFSGSIRGRVSAWRW